ncbi:2-methylfumaryl-CoA isomerase [Rhodovastum atsumiense]|uniref:2-methylfumaryl-CoA isomerase n=1 Tax=Rhodovastum atsumiense TaxID=504468 RepID=A0A5M6IM26_9PROT|nr:CoA transferase [Rhodovastum atsumiense]KAA5609282.1 2-methylfumaryl-CoA isomerase [Rhodovastum atsumiense]CAH2604581.1 2-methylfumaryl-CoA isomerase [Rhodovastum atsumiense]
MPGILDGIRVVEASAFVAAPLAGMTLAQMGADVIRFDPVQGGPDARRWPVTADGQSLYWAGLNKGKRSLAVDTTKPEGQALVRALLAAPGPGNGLFLTNLPTGKGWMSYEALRAERPDLIMLELVGNPDGSAAVDYTVNCAVGFPFVTGPDRGSAAVNPVNHVMPVWDALAGTHLALALLAAERHRRLTGEGQKVRIALSDIAFAMTGHLGCIAEVEVNDTDRRACGNELYGAYGAPFETRDGRLIYIAVVTDRMWRELGKATGLAARFEALEALLECDLRHREGDRFQAREAISALLRPWCLARSLDEIRTAFDGTGVCWGPYQTFRQMLAEDPRCSPANAMFAMLDQPGIGRYRVPGSPIAFGALPRQPPRRAPLLGEHTDEILRQELGLSDTEIGRLRAAGVVAGPPQVT